ncbi:hypothetical protein ABFS82_08G175300 [Erythranthe guttata]|uniref:NEP1-interacting protein-like 2 n=1 Tax=Erythranthe guttata TaxID=4155 RepID=UPI00064DB2BB|nr:PREDICTED: NEP1-interacting protein-like 2 [Erythranthe guttata]|eukprot:XP_012841649.1 PREDICTED: NEP1-interacting protein-like 2 [Erythranthe guttata]
MLLCCYSVIKRWFSDSSSWFLAVGIVKKFAVAIVTCMFALGGAIIGAIIGAIKGQTTETGLSRGFGVGAVAGAITAVQLMELIANGEPFSKVALLRSLVNGKIFTEWVSTTEMNSSEISDTFDINFTWGLSQDEIEQLPVDEFINDETTTLFSETSCPICLQDLKDGEAVRFLPNCKHLYHLCCIDEWLSRQGNCPICRKRV